MSSSYFTLDCSADVSPKYIEHILSNQAILEFAIEIVAFHPMSKIYRISLFFKEFLTEDEIEKIMEELRERLVSVICLVTQVDVKASDEITIDNNGNVYTIVSRTDTKVPQKRKSLVKVLFNKDKLDKMSKGEWAALKRFKKAFISVPIEEQFESVVGTIDSLGKIKYGGGVGRRMRLFLQNDLKISKELADLIVKERGFKIHENRLEKINRDSIYKIRAIVANYLAGILGIELEKNFIEMGDVFKIVYSHS